jgi:hypothetical protein
MEKITYNGIEFELNNDIDDMLIKYLFKQKKMYKDIVELQQWKENIKGTLDGLKKRLNVVENSERKIESLKIQLSKIGEQVASLQNIIANENNRKKSEKQKEYNEYISEFEAIQTEIVKTNRQPIMKLLSDYFLCKIKGDMEQVERLIKETKNYDNYSFDGLFRRIDTFLKKQEIIEKDRNQFLTDFIVNPTQGAIFDAKTHNNIDVYFNLQPNKKTIIKDTLAIGLCFPDVEVKTIKAAVICESVL